MNRLLVRGVDIRVSDLGKHEPQRALTQVRVVGPGTGPDGRPVSTFRLSKGSEAALVSYGLDADSKISTLGFAPNREYE